MKKFFLIFLLFIPACAPWMKTGGSYESLPHNFYVNIPQEWMMLDTDKYLLISGDGPFLQYVLIQDRPIDRPFRNTKKKFNRLMLPQEVADVIIDEITSDQSVLNFEIIENAPTRINGHDGFRVVFTYKNRDGLKLKTIYHGFLAGENFYNIRYTAVDRYYFEKDIEAFRKVLESFRLIEDEGNCPGIRISQTMKAN
jgi:hypothetical protein